MTQIKQHTLQSGERILLVSIRDDASRPRVESVYYKPIKRFICNITKGVSIDDLPQGNWQLIGLSDEITEEMATAIVDDEYICCPPEYIYKDYSNTKDISEINCFTSALVSFKSLMQSLGCEGRYAVLREVK